MLDPDAVDLLFDKDLLSPDHWEQVFPRRELPIEAKITRFGPSPTGSLHIGGVYAAMISKDVADHSGGTYFVRIEDTDRKREVAEAFGQFARAFAFFRIESEDAADAPWGPYRQSARERIYHTYARELMRRGFAYPCFATKEELASVAEDQRRRGVPPGYYGQWAIWRDATDEDLRTQLDKGVPYVVRFRAPAEPSRHRFVDLIKGPIDQEENRNDVVVLKSSDEAERLPTYHFAHAVDDHLMRANLVIRGDEWLNSVSLHHQLFDALGFDRVDYAHIAPLMKIDGRSRRKLSKRKDPEASVDFYMESGYPPDAVLVYLRGLANGRLADVPARQALAEPLRLAECGAAGPLFDRVKLDDISKDLIATMRSAEILDAVLRWGADYDPDLVEVLGASRELALAALDVERVGTDNPRKDLARWSDFRPHYGLFFPALFTLVTDTGDERFNGLDPQLVRTVAADVAEHYAFHDEQSVWFEQIRAVAQRHGFALSAKEYKSNPSAFHGAVKDAANVIRVALTGSSRSPDLHAIARVLGADEVLRRLHAPAG